MNPLVDFIAVPYSGPLPWAELLARLPRALCLEDVECDPADDEDDIYKAIAHVTLAELEQHLTARRQTLVGELLVHQALLILRNRALEAGVGSHESVLAAVSRGKAAHP